MNHKETRMVKNGEDKHELKTTNFKNVRLTFQRCTNCDVAPFIDKIGKKGAVRLYFKLKGSKCIQVNWISMQRIQLVGPWETRTSPQSPDTSISWASTARKIAKAKCKILSNDMPSIVS